MGWFSSVCSSIGSAIGSVCSRIGGAVSSFASGVGSVIGGLISGLPAALGTLGKVASAIFQGLGIFKPDEKPPELGDRALQAAEQGITVEKFDNFADYMTELRKFPLDPEKSKKYSESEKMVAGVGVGTMGTEEKFNMASGSLNSMWLLPMANEKYFTPDRMQTLISTGRLGGDVFAYLEKRLSAGETRTLEKRLEINPDGSAMNNDEINALYDELDNARDHFAQQCTQVENEHKSKQGE